MSVITKKVQGRRTVCYESYNDLLADAEELARNKVRTLGNWSLGQIFKHIAMATDSSIDGSGFMLPAPVRLLMRLLMKRRFLDKTLSAGFKSPDAFIPRETSVEEGLAALHEAVARQSRELSRALHPGFGRLSREGWNEFNLRHAEMHMSFAVPDTAAANANP